jgi:hypothetical protein
MRLKKGSQVTYIKKYANEAQEGSQVTYIKKYANEAQEEFSGHIYKEICK